MTRIIARSGLLLTSLGWLSRSTLSKGLAALAFGTLASHASLGTAGETLDRVMADKTMVQVVDRAFPPFSYIDDSGEVVGFDVDVAREFAKRLGVDMRIETPSWEIITAGNWQGRWDICVCSMTPTAERAEVLDFVLQYISVPAIVVVDAKTPTSRERQISLVKRLVSRLARLTKDTS